MTNILTEKHSNLKQKPIKENPLVSVIVITYNSSKYVIETLESAKAQTYKNIELIISDDCSTDNTINVCELWLKNNKAFFKRTKLITVKENTGIPKNCNRGLDAAKGEWIKMIAGDDALMSNCITDNIEFVNSDENIKFCFSDYKSYSNTFEEKNLIKEDIRTRERAAMFSELSTPYQLEVIARGSVPHGGATFIHTKTLLFFGGYDETFPYIEDWSTWYRLLKNRVRLHYLEKKTIKYRLHSEAITKKVKSKNNFSLVTIKTGVVIKKLMLNHYKKKEKFLFMLEEAYYRYYQNKKINTIFAKIIRRIWYFFVNKSLEERKKALQSYHDKQLKFILK